MRSLLLLLLTWSLQCVLSSSSSRIPGKKILVVGGSGRVGGSAVKAISQRFQDCSVAVGGRNIENFRACRQRHNLASNVEFVPIDIFNDEELSRIIPSYDIIVHTAGPFQGLKTPALLEKTLALGKKYIDVCDDVPLSGICRSDVYQALAKKGKGSAVISTGIWPGGSSLLAQEVIQCAGGPQNIRNLTFSFFTAGSGGAGKTILTATFLILGENVITYVDNNLVYKKSATDKRVVDFGSRIGPRDVARLSLIECESCHLSGVKSVETYFGTAPPFWNSLFVAMTRIIPQSILQNRELMDVFAAASLPMVRLVDSLVGSTNGIRIDADTEDGRRFVGLMTHEDLEEIVGISIAAFVNQMLLDRVPPGVYFPEEVPGDEFRAEILRDIRQSAITYSISEQL